MHFITPAGNLFFLIVWLPVLWLRFFRLSILESVHHLVLAENSIKYSSHNNLAIFSNIFFEFNFGKFSNLPLVLISPWVAVYSRKMTHFPLPVLQFYGKSANGVFMLSGFVYVFLSFFVLLLFLLDSSFFSPFMPPVYYYNFLFLWSCFFIFYLQSAARVMWYILFVCCMPSSWLFLLIVYFRLLPTSVVFTGRTLAHISFIGFLLILLCGFFALRCGFSTLFFQLHPTPEATLPPLRIAAEFSTVEFLLDNFFKGGRYGGLLLIGIWGFIVPFSLQDTTSSTPPKHFLYFYSYSNAGPQLIIPTNLVSL